MAISSTSKTGTTIPDRKTSHSETEETKEATLVLFDFDGTITTRDTLIEFVLFYRGKKKYWLGMLKLSPLLALYALKLIPNWKAKQFFLSHYFKGEPIDEFNTRGREFARQVLPKLIRPGALEAIATYKKNNAAIAVVSASAENWIKPWCDQYDINCVATRLQVTDGFITGKIDGRNCYGDEKVCRIRDEYTLEDYDRIVAYGDSSGDKEMLALAHDRHYKPWR